MRILVTGATGNVGRLVVDHLLAAGATEVLALTANPAKAALPDGVEVVEGYLGRRDIPFVELTHEQAVGQLSAVMGEYAAWYLDRMA